MSAVWEFVTSTPMLVLIGGISLMLMMDDSRRRGSVQSYANRSYTEPSYRDSSYSSPSYGGGLDDKQNFQKLLTYVKSGDICGASGFLENVQFSDRFIKDAKDYVESLRPKTGGKKSKRSRRTRRTRRH